MTSGSRSKSLYPYVHITPPTSKAKGSECIHDGAYNRLGAGHVLCEAWVFRLSSVGLDRVSAGDLPWKVMLKQSQEPCVAVLEPLQFIPVPASPNGKSFN